MNSIRRRGPAAAITELTLLAAGCGGSSPKPTIAAGGQSNGNLVTQAYGYAAGMRDHGVTSFPDPRVSTSGASTQISQMARSGPVSTPQFKAALVACRSIVPAPSNADLAAETQQRRARAEGLLAFARCMRGRAVIGFPDPNGQGALTAAMVKSAGIEVTAPRVRAAGLACVPASNGALTRAQVIQATSGNPPPGG